MINILMNKEGTVNFRFLLNEYMDPIEFKDEAEADLYIKKYTNNVEPKMGKFIFVEMVKTKSYIYQYNS